MRSDEFKLKRKRAAASAEPYLCHITEGRWKRGEFDGWKGGRPIWGRLSTPGLHRFGSGSWEYPLGGCFGCGSGACTKNTRGGLRR